MSIRTADLPFQQMPEPTADLKATSGEEGSMTHGSKQAMGSDLRCPHLPGQDGPGGARLWIDRGIFAGIPSGEPFCFKAI